MGVRLPTAFARAAIAVFIGVVSLSVAFAVLHDTSSLGNFLLVTAYWTGPWLGVVLADRLLVRTRGDDLALLTDRSHRNWAGPIAMTVAVIVSIALFCNQTAYVGLLARAYPGLGDLTFEVGIALAFALYRAASTYEVGAAPVPTPIAENVTRAPSAGAAVLPADGACW